ncbi:MAG: acyl-CoA dehydrogenase family protein [Microbacterium sp.]
MDFELDDEQSALKEVTRDVLARYAGPDAARAIVDGAAEPAADLRAAGAEVGWLALAVPEEQDGLGCGLVELAIVAEELGRALAPWPFAETALVARALARSREPGVADILAALVSGQELAAFAVAEPGRGFSPADAAAVARQGGEGLVVSGEKTAVESAAAVDWLAVAATAPEERAILLVRRDDPRVAVEAERGLDATRPRFRVVLDDAPVQATLARGADADELVDAAALMTSADALGAADTLLSRTVDYVKVREQFGRPIGSFQAVKHAAADMLRRVRGARAAISYAAMASDAGAPEARRATAVANAYASAEFGRVAGQALQLHGGIGFTWEHDLHLYLRRVKADEILYGDGAVHREKVLATHRV